jgi:hypothetical protein
MARFNDANLQAKKGITEPAGHKLKARSPEERLGKRLHYSGLGREEHIEEPESPEWRRLRGRQSGAAHGNNKLFKRLEYGGGNVRVADYGTTNSEGRRDNGVITLESKARSPQDGVAHGDSKC